MPVLLKGKIKPPGNAFGIYAIFICFVCVYRKCMRDLMLRLVPLILHLLFFYFSVLRQKFHFSFPVAEIDFTSLITRGKYK